jgi:hypothetical protein
MPTYDDSAFVIFSAADMAFFTVVICESDGHWAARLRNELGADRIRLCETRRLVDCQRALADSSASLALLEWSAGRRAELADFVDRVNRRFPRVSVLALAQRAAAAEEALAREAGVIHFANSLRALAPVARLIRRHRVRAASMADDPAQQFFESLAGNSE